MHAAFAGEEGIAERSVLLLPPYCEWLRYDGFRRIWYFHIGVYNGFLMLFSLGREAEIGGAKQHHRYHEQEKAQIPLGDTFSHSDTLLDLEKLCDT